MSDANLIASVLVCSSLGSLLGFGTGLIPGFHMNNVAAAFVANATLVIAVFMTVGGSFGDSHVAIAVSCVLCSAMVSHAFSESIASTYLGIPAEDNVSVLPAHKLAKAGYGSSAVVASASGSISGVLIGSALLLPMCLVMGEPIEAYSVIKDYMGVIILGLSFLMLSSEVTPHLKARTPLTGVIVKSAKALGIFLCSGLIGLAVLRTSYSSCAMPELPWFSKDYVTPASLLLPLFAGLFGIPSILLSLRSKSIIELPNARIRCARGSLRAREITLAILGGLMVGWLPGMTAGSTASLCSPAAREVQDGGELEHALRFIWLYAAISAVGAVFAVGALFTIGRARSGTMEAVSSFLGDVNDVPAASSLSSPVSIVLSMGIAALTSYWLIRMIGPRLGGMRRIMCSRRVAIASVLFVICLSVALTGARGILLLATAAALGLIPPRIGVRRIMLMGCLLVPIMVQFLVGV